MTTPIELTDALKDITFVDKFFVWLRWNLYILGASAILLTGYICKFGLPGVCKTIELSHLNEQVEMLGLALSEVQDWQVAQAQRNKTQMARK